MWWQEGVVKKGRGERMMTTGEIKVLTNEGLEVVFYSTNTACKYLSAVALKHSVV